MTRLSKTALTLGTINFLGGLSCILGTIYMSRSQGSMDPLADLALIICLLVFLLIYPATIVGGSISIAAVIFEKNKWPAILATLLCFVGLLLFYGSYMV